MLKPHHFLDTKRCFILSQYHHPDGSITGKVKYRGVTYNVLFDKEGKLHANPIL